MLPQLRLKLVVHKYRWVTLLKCLAAFKIMQDSTARSKMLLQRVNTYNNTHKERGKDCLSNLQEFFHGKINQFNLFFFFFGHPERHFRNQGWNPHPLQWTCRILTTGPPGKSLNFIRFSLNNFKDLWMKQHVIHCRGVWSQLSVLPLNSQPLHTRAHISQASSCKDSYSSLYISLPGFSPELPVLLVVGRKYWWFFEQSIWVQIAGAVWGRAPAGANVWNVTAYSRWASEGRGQLHTKCPFLEIQAFGGLFNCAGNNAGCRGLKSQTKGEIIWSQTHSCFVLFFATYNDFIKYVGDLIIILKWPTT